MQDKCKISDGEDVGVRFDQITVLTRSIRTDRSEQTVWTQVRRHKTRSTLFASHLAILDALTCSKMNVVLEI